ncbi:MAG: hypothetical protein ACRCXA_09040 [Peptostreptococcaceae bacterium]
MYKIEDIKKELEQLCEEYVDVLEGLKNKKEITEDTFEKCVSNKVLFLDR